jgi:hypothetical protein
MAVTLVPVRLLAPTATAVALVLSACDASPELAATDAAVPTPTPTTEQETTPTEAPAADELTLSETEIPGLLQNSVTFTDVTYTITAGIVSNQAPRTFGAGGEPTVEPTLHLFLSMNGSNATQRRSELTITDFALVLADGTEVPITRVFGPSEAFITPPPHAAADGYLAFPVDPDLDLVGAQLRIGQPPDRPAFIALTDPQPEPDYPIALNVTGEAPGIGITNRSQMRYTVLGGQLHIDNPLDAPNRETGRRANVDELFLVLDMRVLIETGRAEGLFADQFRLFVDGVPRAPYHWPAGGNLSQGAAVDTQVGWLIPADATELVLQVGDPDEDPGLIPVELPADRP